MPVKLIQGSDKGRHPDIVDAMFRLRKAVFKDRLGWDVTVRDGWEMDGYDDLNPLYLVSRDGRGAVQGSLRLMPTTGPTLLTDVFAGNFDEPVDVRSPTVWEGTRFCVQADAADPAPGRGGLNPALGRGGLNPATVDLFTAMCEVGLRAGLTHIIGVYDPRLIRIYRRIGWSPEPLAESRAFAHGPVYVGLWEVSEAALATMRDRCGLTGSVLDSEPAGPPGVRAA